MVNDKLLISDIMNFNHSRNKAKKKKHFIPRSLSSIVSSVPSNIVMLV